MSTEGLHADIQQALQTLITSTIDAEQSDLALARLAEASRTDPNLRCVLGEPQNMEGLVDSVWFFMDESPDSTALALRCIGNACIDNDRARDAVTKLGFTWAGLCLQYEIDDEVEWLTVKVFYNICSEHEAAQQRCFQDRVHHKLVSLCTSPLAQNRDERTLLFDLLFWITGRKAHVTEGTISEPLPQDTLLELLNLPYYHAKTAGLEDFATLVEICLTFLRDPLVQTQVIEHRWVGYVWQTAQEIENKLLAEDGSSETDEVLKPLLSSLIWCLSDIAANPAFAQEYSLDDAWIKGLVHVIKAEGGEVDVEPADIVDSSELGQRLYQEARATRNDTSQQSDVGRGSHRLVGGACQIIGNLLWALPSDTAAPLVETHALQIPLWRTFVSQERLTDDDIQHSAAGLLIQLTRPSPHVRELIGDDEKAETALRVMWQHKTPQIKQDGIKLLRALGKDCPVNQRRFDGLAAEMTVAGASDMPVRNGS